MVTLYLPEEVGDARVLLSAVDDEALEPARVLGPDLIEDDGAVGSGLRRGRMGRHPFLILEPGTESLKDGNKIILLSNRQRLREQSPSSRNLLSVLF